MKMSTLSYVIADLTICIEHASSKYGTSGSTKKLLPFHIL